MNGLCFTGGGVFCYAQAKALVGFDPSRVDVFAGTSGGSLNALALAAGISADDLLGARVAAHSAGGRLPQIQRPGAEPGGR